MQLDWVTVSEINNYGFEVQKSSSQLSGFQTIPNSFIAGHGTTLEPHQYSFVDRNANATEVYYRLKQIDLDGTENFVDPIRVATPTEVSTTALPQTFSLGQNYPNPFNPSTTIRYALLTATYVSLELFNSSGQRIAELAKGIQTAGEHSVQFDASGFASGVYLYRLRAGNFIETKKMLLTK